MEFAAKPLIKFVEYNLYAAEAEVRGPTSQQRVEVIHDKTFDVTTATQSEQNADFRPEAFHSFRRNFESALFVKGHRVG
jgi:hypothetical protein